MKRWRWRWRQRWKQSCGRWWWWWSASCLNGFHLVIACLNTFWLFVNFF